MHIKDKVAVITGAASGIGHAVSLDLARHGAKTLVLVDLTEQVFEVADEINRQYSQDTAIAFQGDTTDEAFRKEVYDTVCDQYAIPQICIPAAGIARDALMIKINKELGKAEIYPAETFRKVTEVDLIAPIYWAMEMLGRIAEDRYHKGLRRWDPKEKVQGTVIFIGSVSSQGNKGQIAYATSKAGLEGAAASMMKESLFHGVRCGVIHPGYTDTPMVRALGDEFIEKYILPYTQLNRLVRPEEIADAICFMISNSAVSGELWADAGWHPAPG